MSKHQRLTLITMTAALTAAFLCGCAGSLAAGEPLPSPAQEAFTTDHPADTTAAPVTVTLYVPREDGEYLDAVTAVVDNPTAQGLLDALARTGALGVRPIRVLSCTLDTELITLDGQTRDTLVAALDLDGAFEEYILSCDSAREALVVTALVNTFLYSTGADCLRLTVDGEPLASSHAVYDSPIVPDAFANTRTGGLLS